MDLIVGRVAMNSIKEQLKVCSNVLSQYKVYLLLFQSLMVVTVGPRCSVK